MKQHVTRDLSLQGHYAGPVTRLAAYAIDLGAVIGLFALGSLVLDWTVDLLMSSDFQLSDYRVANTLAFIGWSFLYFFYPWATAGRSLGMAVVGIRIVARDGSPIRPRQAFVRLVTFPLSFLAFGLGFLGIITRREHQAWHDRIAGTAVVYAWDARAARLRFLAKQPVDASADAAPAAPVASGTPR